MTILIGAFGGSVGAVARYLLSGAIQKRARSSMPVGTAVVNLLGALGVGVILGIDPKPTGWMLAASGFTAGFTTFSTWMVETARLGVLPTPTVRAMANLVVLAIVGVGCAAAGYHLVV